MKHEGLWVEGSLVPIWTGDDGENYIAAPHYESLRQRHVALGEAVASVLRMHATLSMPAPVRPVNMSGGQEKDYYAEVAAWRLVRDSAAKEFPEALRRLKGML